jgi:uncharacterized protein with GYD domain
MKIQGNPKERDWMMVRLTRPKERRVGMATYLLFGEYSHDSVKQISARRTDKAADLIKKHGGELKSGYALLGGVDLVLILDLPDTQSAMKVSVGLTKLLGISFTTAPAVPFEEFDKLMEGV